MRRGMGGGQGLGATKGATEYMQQERGGDALSPSGCTEVESEQGHPGDSWPRQPGDWREGLRSKGEQRARPPRGPQTEISSSCGGGGWAENETLEPLAAAGEAG